MFERPPSAIAGDPTPGVTIPNGWIGITLVFVLVASWMSFMVGRDLGIRSERKLQEAVFCPEVMFVKK